MHKTELFRYVGNDEIKTFKDIQDDYMEEVGAYLPIPYDEMHLIIMLRLVQNGGNIVIINDDILAWCNEFAEYNEAERYLSQNERDMSVRNIYENISSKDSFVEHIKECLVEPDGAELLARLNTFLQ